MLGSDLTAKRISSWLADRKTTPGARRKYLYALSSFVHHLRSVGAIDHNPVELVPVPKKNPARLRWETGDIDRKIVDAAPEPYRALFAFIKGTGAEVSAALAAVRRDVHLGRGTIHVRGTKTASRNRHEVILEPWAEPYLAAHGSGLARNDRLWPELSRLQAHAADEAACLAAGVEAYTLRDARHSVAVRARKRGLSLEWIAQQLGHKGILQAATVYAVFTKDIEERRAEAAATEEAQKSPSTVTHSVTRAESSDANAEAR